MFSHTVFPMLKAVSPIALTAVCKALTILSIMYLGLSSAFIKPSNQLLKASLTCLAKSTILSNVLSKSRTESIQSLKPTIASPMPAATSKILRPKASNILEIILKAIFKGPPTTVVIISRSANKPLKIL